MAVELATAYVSVVPSARGMAGNLAGELRVPLDRAGADAGDAAHRSFGQRFTPGIRRLAIAAGGILVANLGFSALRDTISAASDLNETVSTSEAIFGDASGEIRSWAEGAATSIGQSQQQALEATSIFGNMFQQLGVGSSDAADMSVAMTELASDFASFHNVDITQVLEAQQAAFRGEYDAVQRFVPTINAAAVEQKALELGLADTTSELTAQDKALATQELLMEGAGAAAGDFARTSDGLANKQRILGARIDDIQAKIGQALIPVMESLTGFILDKVLPVVEDLVDAWNENGFAGVLDLIEEKIPAIEGVLSTLRTAISAVYDYVKDNEWVLEGLATLVGVVLAGAFLVWATNAAIAAAANFLAIAPVLLLAAAIAGLVALVIWAYNEYEWLRNVIHKWVIPALETFGKIIGGFVLTQVQNMAGAISTLTGALGALYEAWQRVSGFLLHGSFGGNIQGMIDQARSASKVSRFHSGGVVPGRPGQEVPAVLMAGETVLPTHDPDFGGVGTTYVFPNYVGDRSELVRVMDWRERTRRLGLQAAGVR